MELVAKRTIPVVLAAVFLLAAWQPAQAADSATALEQAVTCRKNAWFFTEQRVLRGWAWGAKGNGRKKLPTYISALESSNHVQLYSLSTPDGRTVRGRKVSFAKEKPSVAVIIASGNIATADSMIHRIEPVLKAAQHDYFFLDYRGYGLSKESYPSIQAFIQDFVSMADDLRHRGYSKVMAYGPSFGGIILLNAAARGMKLDKLLIDSVPSNLNDYKCDISIAPSTVLNSSCPNVVALTSTNDGEVSPAAQEELLSIIKAQPCGGRVITLVSAIHALNDQVGSAGDRERMNEIAALLAEE